jgi:chromosome segregation protein
LRAAETNMSRLDDVIREVEGQLQSLKRQARQAARYRNLSGLIRKAEALALHLRWSLSAVQMRAAEAALESAASAVAECTERSAVAATVQINASADLPPLRVIESEKGAALHRLIVERDALDAEEARAREAAQRLRQRIGQSDQDIVREQALDADAQTALAKLAQESKSLEAMSARAAEDLTAAEAVSAS